MTKTILLTLTLALLTGCASIDNGQRQIEDLQEYYREKSDLLDKLNPFTPDDPAPEPVTEELPFAWSDVEKCGGDRLVGDWAVIGDIVSLTVARHVTWTYNAGAQAAIDTWRSTGAISKDPNACIGGIVEWEPGKFCQFTGEWLPKGYKLQTRKVFECCRDHKGKTKHFFSGSMKHATMDDFRGKRIWWYVSALNWCGQANVQERTRLFGPMVME